MTCILFAKRDGVLFAGADGRITCDDDLIWTEDDIKIQVIGCVAVGGAGDAGMISTVHKELPEVDFNPLTAEEVAIWLGQFARKKGKKHHASMWVIGDPDEGSPFWLVDTDGLITQIRRPCYGMGSGGNIAETYMIGREYNCLNVHDAVNSAMQFKPSCGPIRTFHMLSRPEPEDSSDNTP